jgi:heptosyltransferase-2
VTASFLFDFNLKFSCNLRVKKILIIQTAFIGDVILATALVEQISRQYPETGIHFLLRKGNENLLANNPHLKKVFVWNKKYQKYRSLFRLISEIRKEQYDLLLNLQRFASTGFLSVLSKAGERRGFCTNPLSFLYDDAVPHKIGDGTHEIERNQHLLRLQKPVTTCLPRLYPSEKDYERVKMYKKEDYICIAPTSVWFTKQFPLDRWVEVINHLSHKVFLLGGPDDFEACGYIADQTGGISENLSGKLSFLESAALMADAKMNYVNDSAPAHIASAVNAPVREVFCSTTPAFGFGPLSEDSRVIEIKDDLYCRPCGIHGFKKCPEGHFKCAKDIKTEQFLL